LYSDPISGTRTARAISTIVDFHIPAQSSGNGLRVDARLQGCVPESGISHCQCGLNRRRRSGLGRFRRCRGR
jgi:hypothetical protein